MMFLVEEGLLWLYTFFEDIYYRNCIAVKKLFIDKRKQKLL